MALFVVNRYVGEEESDSADKSQLLLQRLQEQARVRELQKRQQGQVTSVESRGPENEISVLDVGEESKQEAGKKRKHEGSPASKSHRKKKKRLQDGGEEVVGGKGGGHQKNTSGAAAATEERKGSFGAREEDYQGSEREQSPREALPPAGVIILGGCTQKTVARVQPLLPPWLAQPKLVQRRIKENLVPLQDVPVIHPKLVKKLQANGIESLFPVQAEVIPAILESGASGFLAGRGGYQPSDICVSAPTGSGKTLAFVIPVVQALLDRVVCRVRALIVLPTKELAQQVSKVFNIYTDGTGLKVVQVTGQKSFAKEQESLFEKTLTGFRSLADIVVATPGRLVDHLQQSPAFSLRDLRFLVIDEADRMIDGMHQDWLQQAVEAASRAEEAAGALGLFGRRAEQKPLTAAKACCPQLPLQKLLFSATLTRNPEKLQQLGLFQPRLFMPASSEPQVVAPQDVEKKYALPEGLSQYYVPCSLSWKPLFLLHFLLRLKFSRVLCFANSKETSHRLFLLLRAFGGVTVAEFSSRLSPTQRKRTLKEFEQGKIQLLISTDATARGIDIAGVKCVISYDAPQFIRTYIHRVGRTARAGKAGLAFTLLLKPQESKFLKMLRAAGLPRLEQQLVKSQHLQPLLPRYEEALAELQNTVKEERAEKRS
uniref:ATP-dependent RNA helicase n=1 Tax=Pogona vitticeps TaxID=103695 RepID=A0ABM5F238_9SAUR